MSRLQVIVGSTRPTRSADLVVPWVVEKASAHGAFGVEVLDLRDWPLPVFGEHAGTIGDIADPAYSDPLVKRWNEEVKQADAYLVVTPEYNHSIPGVLKNALDNLFLSFALRNKPLAAVGYSSGLAAGARAIEHLVQIAVEAEAMPLRNTVIVPRVTEAFGDGVGDGAGEPTDPTHRIGLEVLLDDLAWWSAALERARAEGELVPGVLRLQAGLAALREGG